MNELLLVLVAVGVGLLAAAPGIAALIAGRRQVAAAAERPDGAVEALVLTQLREQVAAQQKTIRFLTARMDQLEKARAAEFAETESLREETESWREETESLRQEVRELWRGVQELTRQIVETAKLAPVWQPPSAAAGKRKRPSTARAAELRDRIVEQYSAEEIDDLAFRLRVEPDELEGETKTTRARSLVETMRRGGRLDELVEQCRTDRPSGGF